MYIMEDQMLYRIALTRIPMVGPVIAKNLISYCGGARAVFHSKRRQLLKVPGVGDIIANNILRQQALPEAEAEMRWISENDVSALFFMDKEYPQRLRQYPDCPILLYYRGDADLNAQRTVGIIGTRRPTFYGTARCESLVRELKPYEVVVVSGLAYGIDGVAHRCCVETGIPTVGVLGHGLDVIYPPAHRKLAGRMCQRGGLLTEYPSKTQPDREHFPMRNRIIAALCDALIVVETARRGGSMITADLANSYNKDVFALPGRAGDEMSSGCNLLIKSHRAALLESIADLAYNMGWDEDGKPAAMQQKLFVELTEEEKIIVDLLRKSEQLGIDTLALEARMPGNRLASLLLNLEFKGLIRSLPGKYYTLMRR